MIERRLPWKKKFRVRELEKEVGPSPKSTEGEKGETARVPFLLEGTGDAAMGEEDDGFLTCFAGDPYVAAAGNGSGGADDADDHDEGGGAANRTVSEFEQVGRIA